MSLLKKPKFKDVELSEDVDDLIEMDELLYRLADKEQEIQELYQRVEHMERQLKKYKQFGIWDAQTQLKMIEVLKETTKRSAFVDRFGGVVEHEQKA